MPEILAPAGDMTALRAAVNNGADAVYLGLSAFSARAKAANFDVEGLREVVRFCHTFGVRVYVAFNTLLKDSEIKSAVELVERAAEAGADAFILQDLGLLYELKARGLKLELHASTQMGIHNLEGAIVAERLGFKRVILSRETLLEDIGRIKSGTGIELEFFIQGALCVSFSGNCYFSSLIAGESGNRGRCLQFCRKNYQLLNRSAEKTLADGCLLSPCDLKLSARLKELVDAGITSFKIEGRLRRPEYVGEAVRFYKKALCGPPSQDDENRLKIMFNRGNYCEAHLTNPTDDIIYPYHPAHIGLLVGSVRGVAGFGTQKNARIQYEKGMPLLKKGDGIKFIRDGREVGTAVVHDPGYITFAGDVRMRDEVRLTTSAELNAEVLAVKRQIKLTAYVYLRPGEPANLKLSDGKKSVTVCGTNSVQISQTAPLTQKNLEILRKIDDEFYIMTDIVSDMTNNCFLSVSELKDLRRAAMAKFREVAGRIASARNRDATLAGDLHAVVDYFSELHFLNLPKDRRVFVMLDSADRLTDEILSRSDYVVLNPPEYTVLVVQKFLSAVGTQKAVLSFPNLMRGDDAKILREIVQTSGVEIFVVNNLYGFELCRNKKVIAGMMLNLLNGCLDIQKIASVESERSQKGAINYVYGHVPLMTLSHCPEKNHLNRTCKSCSGGRESLSLLDERGAEFPLRRFKTVYCYRQLLNGVPLDNREILCYNDCSALIDLTIESNPTEKLRDILTRPHSDFPHTHGNYKKELR